MDTVTDTIDPRDVEQIVDGLTRYNEANSDVGNWHQKVFVVRDEHEQVSQASSATSTGTGCTSTSSLCSLHADTQAWGPGC